MKKLILSLIVLFLVGCSPSVTIKQVTESVKKDDTYNGNSYSYLPPYLSFDSILPELDKVADSTLYNKKAPVFDPIPLSPGKYGSLEVKGGILLCEKDIALYIKDNAEARRYKAEKGASETLRRHYYIQSVRAESLYQKKIYDVEKTNIQLNENIKELQAKSDRKAWYGFFGGSAVAVAIFYAVHYTITVSK